DMQLSPVSLGAEMLVDALPHAWSMLVHLAGEGAASKLTCSETGPDSIQVAGTYEGERAVTRFSFDMQHCPEQPRPFAYSINGHRVDRIIEPASYAMSFNGNDVTTPIRDPLAARIERIVTLVSENAYNSDLDKQVLETQLLEKSIEVLSA
ncbi:MAG: hypothetical protein ACR2QG_00270, partial [Gammaproteobacteria bacterium]